MCRLRLGSRSWWVTFALALPLLSQPGYVPAETPGARRPNVVIVLADDLGWAELGCYGNRFNETPRLDAMAARGVRFTQAYAAAPVCSPFRASLLAGQWPVRTGITDYLRPNDRKHLDTKLITLAEVFQASGYTTGILGKWHLTGYRTAGVADEVTPAAHGFAEVRLSENASIGGGSYFHPYHFNRTVERRLFPQAAVQDRKGQTAAADPRDTAEFLVERMNLEAVEFIERHRDRPFFLYKSHYAVHTSLNAPPRRVKKFLAKEGATTTRDGKPNNVYLAAQLEAIDEGVGMILDKLTELELADDTIVIFMSDNGGESHVTSNAPLRAGKSTLYEGGIRVPLVVHWPRRVGPGVVSHEPVASVDLYPTLLAAAGLESPGEPQGSDEKQPHILDGVSLLPLLTDAAAQLPSRNLYWHYPLAKPHFLGGRSSGAIRQGEWKLIEHFDVAADAVDRLELYDLKSDGGETRNLVADEPARAARLREALATWRREVGAEVPDGQRLDP
ncbi:MAG: DUF4976 domain-containing protein [Planctomycetota bacterium]|nr:MAG: DUF4976 domain-containing protein [Planctomycetota bacterium]REK43611.1 MAG: DUF4976 domain-containing protein [Planctomycetota bacterium]